MDNDGHIGGGGGRTHPAATLNGVRAETRLGVLCSTVRCDATGGPNAQNGAILMHAVEAGNAKSFTQTFAAFKYAHANLTFLELGDIGCVALSRIIELGMWPTEDGCSRVMLELSHNSFGDEGAIALAAALLSDRAPRGLSVQVASCFVGDAGAAALAGAPFGDHFNLSRNEIGDAGAKAIASQIALGKGPTAERDGSVNLGGNRGITDVGVAALTSAVSSGNTSKLLRTIDVDGTGASDAAQDALFEALAAHRAAYPVAAVGFG